MTFAAGALDPAPVSLRDADAWRVAALFVPIAFVAAVLVHVFVLERFANSGDEHAYLWQATAFAQGRVTAVSPQPQEAFRLNHVGDVGGRRFSKYPPGWPLLLAAGVALGASGLVNPLLGALAIAGIFRLGCTWVGRRAALLGATFVMVTPFFLLNAGSYHSHPAALFALTALALSLTWTSEKPSSAALLLAGASFGLAVLVRPFTALLIGLPLLAAFAPAVIARQPRGLVSVVLFGLGGLPAALFLALVNSAVTGAWWQMAWTYYDPSEVIGFTSYGHSVVQGLKTMVRLVGEGLVYTAIVGAVLVLLAWRQPFAYRRLAWVLLLAPVVGHIFWWSHGGNRYGPRFYFEALLPFTLLAGSGAERLTSTRWFRPALITGGIALVAANVALLTQAHREVHARRDLYRAVDAAGLRNAVVLLTTASADMVRTDLTRNPPDFENAPVLFALSRGPLDREVTERHQERTAYLYRWTPAGGVLSPLQP